MIHIAIVVALVCGICITGCSGGHSQATIPTINVSGIGESQTIQPGTYYLNVNGMNETVYTSPGTVILSVDVSGNGNTIYIQSGNNPAVNDSGNGNRVISGASNA